MRRFTSAALALAAFVALSAAPVSAQYFVQGSVTLPSGDFGDAFNTGWQGNAGLSVWHNQDQRFNLWAEGFYGQNKLDANSDVKSSQYGGLASGTYNLTSGSSATPYVIGSLGYMAARTSGFGASETNGGFAYGGGAGVSFGKLFVEGRYMGASINNGTLSYLMLGAGVLF